MAEGDNDTCLELALEGEKLCKAGKCRDGVAFFEAALQVRSVLDRFPAACPPLPGLGPGGP
jgi:hypothetical protein